MASSSRVFGGCRALMAAARAKVSVTGAATATAKAPRSSGIQKAAPVSPQLANFLGAPQVSRSEAVKKVWDYIKLHDLQNPANKREIRCDEKLKTIFDGKDKVEFLEIARLMSRHFVKTT